MNNITLTETRLICAIDVGTSSIRVSAFNQAGKAVENLFVQTFYEMKIGKEGSVEIPAEELFLKVANTLDIFLQKLLKENQTQNYLVAGVGVSTIWHSLVALDSSSKALTPLISWNDTRSSLFAKKLRENFNEIALHQKTGCRFHASYWPAKISWLLETKPKIKKEVNYWLSFGDYFFLKLFGETATSPSLASGTGFFNRYSQNWDTEFINNLSLELKNFPKIVETPFYHLSSEYSLRWPQLDNIPWYLPIGDGACNNIGSDCLDNKSFALMIGTSGAMRVTTSEKNIMLPSGLWSYKIDSSRSVVGGAISNAGNLFAWLKDLLNLQLEDIKDIKDLEQKLREIKADSHNLTVLPFLSGERSLGWHDEAKGAILGLGLSSKPLEILRAGLESVAYQFFLIYQELIKIVGTPNKIIATGGGLYNSQIWGEIIADVLGREIYVSKYAETSSRGVALLVLEKLNLLKLTTNNNFEKVYHPNLENKEIYKKAFERYQKYYKKLVLED